MQRGQLLTLFGGVGLLIGAFLPWVTMEAIILGSYSINGIEGDGKITAVLGGILILIGAITKPKPAKIYSLVGVLVAGLAAIALIYDFTNLSKATGSGFGVSAQIGIGLYLSLLGAGLGVFGGIQRLPETEQAMTFTPTPSTVASLVPSLPPAPITSSSSVFTEPHSCPNCGFANQPTNHFCIKCGATLTPTQTVNLSSPQASHVSEEKDEQA